MFVPPPQQLFDHVYCMFSKFGPMKDAKQGLTLFNDEIWKIAKLMHFPKLLIVYNLSFQTSFKVDGNSPCH
jgi:hypothetical protein